MSDTKRSESQTSPADQTAGAHPGTTKTWLPGIEALRGVAALTVVAHHSWSLSNMPRFPGYWIIEGFGLWGVMLFFMLSGYLLADTFWREKPADLRVYAVRRFFRIAPAYYVNITLLFLFFASTRLTFSEQGKTQMLASYTFMHYLFPGTSSSLNVNGALWTLTIEMLLYAFLPIMALAVRYQPWLATALLIAIGLGWRGLIAFHGDGLREFYFGVTDLDPGIQSLFIARQFIGAVAIFALGIGARWLVVHGRLDHVLQGVPSRLGPGLILALLWPGYRVVTWVNAGAPLDAAGYLLVTALILAVGLGIWVVVRMNWQVRTPSWLSVSTSLVLLFPSIMLLRWVEEGSNYRNATLFTVYDFALMVVLLPALLLAARPATPSDPPQRITSWLGERSYSIYLWHFPIILAVYERGPLKRLPAEGGYEWRLPAILLLTLIFAACSYRMVERPGMEYGRKLAQRISSRSQARHTSKNPVNP